MIFFESKRNPPCVRKECLARKVLYTHTKGLQSNFRIFHFELFEEGNRQLLAST